MRRLGASSGTARGGVELCECLLAAPPPCGGWVQVPSLTKNAGGAREGTVAIGGSSVAVSQASGCPAAPTTVSSSSLTFPAAGGTESLSVMGTACCSWPVSDDRAWITATGTSVSTGGSVTVTLPSGHAGESGTVTIGSQDIPVSVTRMACRRTPDSVTPSSLTFPWSGGTQRLTVTGPAHCSWSVSDDQAWITATPSTVPAGGTVQVRVTPGPPGRSGTVAIGGTDVPVTVEPCPTSPTSVTPSSLRFPAAGGTESLSVTGPAGCSWPVSDDQAWIGTTPSRVSDDGRVTVTVGSGSAGQSGTVTIGGRNIPIIVDPCPASPTGVTPTRLTFTSPAGMQNVTVAGPTGCSWPVTASDTWIDVASSSASPGTFAIGVDRNDGSRRMGTVTFGAGGIVTVTQDPVTPPPCPTMPRVSSTSVRLGGSVGATATVRLQEAERCRYEVSENLTWLGAAPSPVAGDALVTFTAREENDTGAGRPGTVMIGGVGGRAVTVTQDPVTPPPCPTMPRVSSTSVRLGSSVGATATVRLQEAERCRYEVSENLTWLGAAPSPVAGDALVTFTAREENDTGAGRPGTVMIGGVGGRAVTVTQDPVTPPPCPTMPRVSPTSLSFGAAGGLGRVSVTGPSDCSWDVSSSPSWIGVSPSSVSNGSRVTVTVPSGHAGESGTVTVGGRSIPVTVGCPPSPASAMPASLSFPAAGGNGTVAVTGQTSCSWNVTSSPSWIGVSPASVSHGDDVRVTVPRGHAGESGTITIGPPIGGLSISVAVRPPLPPPPLLLSLTANAGPDQTVEVGEFVQLDATASTDSDGGSALEYEWNWPLDTAPLVRLGGLRPAPGPRQQFRAPAFATDFPLVFTLTVTDTSGQSATDTVRITVLGQKLTNHRDTLVRNWATRMNYNTPRLACNAYVANDLTARFVFVWNTHRLHRSGLLPEVDGLHGFFGKRHDCGGPEHNRTFKSMSSALFDKFYEVYLRPVGSPSDYTLLPDWKRSGDPAGPHEPFFLSLETYSSIPRGQIHFFHPDWVEIERTFFPDPPLSRCMQAILRVNRNDVCNGTCTVPANYPRPLLPCAQLYSDRVRVDPEEPIPNGPGDAIIISDAYSFEMDQDYLVRHDSSPAPSCGTIMDVYTRRYGDPNWNWRPSFCNASYAAGAPFTFPSIASSRPRAIDILELRARIDGLRRRNGLPPFAWTDATIHLGVTPVRAPHLSELRTAINEAYVAADVHAVPTYTDPIIVAGVTLIKVVHIAELRAAIAVLEQ